jgi:hypothetical protein
MSDITERAAAALDILPEELREPAVAYLIEQAEKFRALQRDIDEAIESVDAGEVREWDFADFLRRANISRSA